MEEEVEAFRLQVQRGRQQEEGPEETLQAQFDTRAAELYAAQTAKSGTSTRVCTDDKGWELIDFPSLAPNKHPESEDSPSSVSCVDNAEGEWALLIH